MNLILCSAKVNQTEGMKVLPYIYYAKLFALKVAKLCRNAT